MVQLSHPYMTLTIGTFTTKVMSLLFNILSRLVIAFFQGASVYFFFVVKLINFIFVGSQITVDADCSHEIKRNLLLRRKTMTKPGSKAETLLYQQRAE